MPKKKKDKEFVTDPLIKKIFGVIIPSINSETPVESFCVYTQTKYPSLLNFKKRNCLSELFVEKMLNLGLFSQEDKIDFKLRKRGIKL